MWWKDGVVLLIAIMHYSIVVMHKKRLSTKCLFLMAIPCQSSKQGHYKTNSKKDIKFPVSRLQLAQCHIVSSLNQC